MLWIEKVGCGPGRGLFAYLLVLLVCLSSQSLGQTYNDFNYRVTGSDVIITGYSGPGGAVTIPSSIPGAGVVASIGNLAFYNSVSLTSVTIPNSVTSIGGFAFAGCTNLTSVNIPNSLTSIGVYVFAYCANVTSITIPNSVNSIGDGAFTDCKSLTSVTIPKSVTNIAAVVFYGCTSLKAINVDPENTAYSSLDGVLFDRSEVLLIQCPAGIAGDYTIPNSVTGIGMYAFCNCASLTSVIIPDSITSIGNYAFESCSNLTSVNIPNSVTDIGNSTFSGCSSLTNVTIPDSVANIGYSAFGGCSNLTSMTIPNSVTNIGERVFYTCTGLASITIGNSVNSIGRGAFEYCTSLTSVTIPSSVTNIGNAAFADCTNLTSVTIPNSVTNIGSGAFADCTSLTSAYFQGNAPSSFGSSVFSYTAPGFTIYYASTATGWTTPTWRGYRAQPYDYRPVVSLIRDLGTVTPSFNGLQPDTNYQLQLSTDLNTWSDTGPPFIATSANQIYPQPFDVGSNKELFFRLQSVP